ncbi:SurA N-terminal domain-containing protein [Rhodocyclaceae bacterium]
MFDLVRNNKRVIQLVLAIVILPFALFGVDAYVNGGGRDEVAKVGDVSISSSEFQENLREQQDRLRQQLGGAIPQEMLDTPALRRAVLEELVNQKVLLRYASDAHIRVSDADLVGFITSVPGLQENGKFSRERYEALVAAQGMSIEMFEARVRQDMLIQQAMMAAGNGTLSAPQSAERWLAAQLEEREIREFSLIADHFISKLDKPDAAAVKRYYEENRKRFEKPEQVKLEFLVLSQEKLVAAAQVSDAEIEAAYKANMARYSTPEQRQASHILIRADKSAPEAAIKEASDKAEQILGQLKAVPGDFAKLAKQHSQDPGSASKGGDLGFFGRGMMVKPFEEAAFALTQGQISSVVRSDFGFHIIQLTGIKPERARPLVEVRGEIAAELKRQAGAKRYAEAAEAFTNMVYEQSDSLKPAAEKYGLNIQTTDWIARGAQMMPPFNNPKLMQAVFTDDALKQQRNTEAVDIGGNTLVSARVLEHRPAEVESLESVQVAIQQALLREAALAMAVTTGEAQLAKLKAGEKTDVNWGSVRSVSRLAAANLPPDGRQAIFAVAGQNVPAFVGAKTPAGYVLYRVEKIKPFDAEAQPGEAASNTMTLRQQYHQAIAQEEVLGWINSLRERYPVKINTAALEKK